MIEIIRPVRQQYTEVILPTNTHGDNFIYQVDIIYIKDSKLLLYDIDKLYAKQIYFEIRKKTGDSFANFVKKFYVVCNYNDTEVLLECGYNIYDFIKNNYKGDKSYKLQITTKEGDYNMGFKSFECNLIENTTNKEFILNNTAKYLINSIKRNIRRIEDNFNIIDSQLLRQYGLSINKIRNKVRSDKLKKLGTND